MPTYVLVDRQRTRERTRARGNAPGNYITKQDAATVYFINFPLTPKHYIKSVLYPKVESHAVETYDNPAPVPPWSYLGPAAQPQKTDYPPQAQTPPRQVPDGLPSGVNPVLPISMRAGSQGAFTPGTTASQLYGNLLKIRRVTVLADTANALNIWIGYQNSITPNNAFPLSPGAARDFDIDDLSQLWLVGENATDQVFFVFEV
jgi:hypothetical protein